MPGKPPQKDPLQMGTPDRPHVLLYSPRERLRNIMVAALMQAGIGVLEASSPYLAVIKAARFSPQTAVIDITDRNTKGFLIVSALRTSLKSRKLPVLLIMPGEPEDLLETMKKEYLADYGRKLPDVAVLKYPFSFSDFIRQIHAL